MAKKKVEVLNAVVDGFGKGAQIEIDERSAEHLERIGYVQILGGVEEAETNSDPTSRTVAELKELAATLEIEGYEGMKKAELIEAIENAEKE